MRFQVSRRLIRPGLTGTLLILALVATAPMPGAQSLPDLEATRAVGRALERMPHYGVFDFVAFRLDRGVVTVEGYAYDPDLGREAAVAVERVPGVDEVANKIETLPVSHEDDRIRWITFYEIYTDDFLVRYAPGGAIGARFDAFQFAGFPYSQPSGYPIHIVVKGGRTTLAGIVDNAGDKHIAEVRAREVGGVLAVNNELIVRNDVLP